MAKSGKQPQMKCFVIDTNVLIHNPNAVFSFSDNIVIIPITVIEELDKFKMMSDKKGMHSRQILRQIDSLIKKGALKKGAKMPNGGILKIAFIHEKISPPNLEPDINDNKILSVAWELQKHNEMVFFVSKDVNARIKAEAMGIRAVDYEKEKVEYSHLFKGWREVTCQSEDIDTLYKDGHLSIKGLTPLENEFLLLRAQNNPSTSALCRYDTAAGCMHPIKNDYEAMGIRALNLEQRFAFDLLLNEKLKLVTLLGQAGTGKTLIAIACALAQTIDKHPIYEKILVARPIIPMGKDIGYLPGTKEQKLNYWMQPIFDNLDYIMKSSGSDHTPNNGDKNDTIDYLLQSKLIEIEALTYVRGRSIPRQFLIVDEAQNLTPHEIKTIVSRAGEGTKIVMTGDPEQIDNPYLDANSNGLVYTVERLKGNSIFGHIFLGKSERSDLATLAVERL